MAIDSLLTKSSEDRLRPAGLCRVLALNLNLRESQASERSGAMKRAASQQIGSCHQTDPRGLSADPSIGFPIR